MVGTMKGSGARSGEQTLEAVEDALRRATTARDLGAFWRLDREGAITRSETVRRASAEGVALAGMPVAVKDLLDVRGLPTTAGLPGEHPPAAADAEAVRRLRAAGAVPIGKTSMDPLACTTGGQAPSFPPCLNPVDAGLSPGGSSSGSAVAVAAGIVPLAIGTDTAGSIRVPAAYTGIVGFKPAHRAVPRRGCVPVMPGFDTVGVLATGVPGCVAGYRALASRIRRDGTDAGGGAASLRTDAATRRVGVLSDLFRESNVEVAAACRGILSALERSDVKLEPVELGWRAQGLGIVLAWELASVWGERVDAEPERFTPLIRDTVAFGRSRGAEGYAEAMSGIVRARARLRRRVAGLDAVVCPTVPIPAPDRDRESTSVSTRFTRIFSALGWPAFSIPAGSDGEGRPIGIQVAAPESRTEKLIAVAALVEEAAGADRHT
ncbi:MAG: Asp-tRNAAsn/Glu-tRNAGln amidotransferase subunit-like amidase [Solirubrobacterales bacterium]|jgi:aspartyl-tRNA(Asn)/glutamyl-tRNA(Gln) amidotransferase subunit A|nr:Asp-tRNAAsn/Glu-tRNAGln amidotransferase subunit-like amidase [Solirubrobacterales bacterium]